MSFLKFVPCAPAPPPSRAALRACHCRSDCSLLFTAAAPSLCPAAGGHAVLAALPNNDAYLVGAAAGRWGVERA